MAARSRSNALFINHVSSKSPRMESVVDSSGFAVPRPPTASTKHVSLPSTSHSPRLGRPPMPKKNEQITFKVENRPDIKKLRAQLKKALPENDVDLPGISPRRNKHTAGIPKKQAAAVLGKEDKPDVRSLQAQLKELQPMVGRVSGARRGRKDAHITAVRNNPLPTIIEEEEKPDISKLRGQLKRGSTEALFGRSPSTRRRKTDSAIASKKNEPIIVDDDKPDVYELRKQLKKGLPEKEFRPATPTRRHRKDSYRASDKSRSLASIIEEPEPDVNKIRAQLKKKLPETVVRSSTASRAGRRSTSSYKKNPVLPMPTIPEEDEKPELSSLKTLLKKPIPETFIPPPSPRGRKKNTSGTSKKNETITIIVDEEKPDLKSLRAQVKKTPTTSARRSKKKETMATITIDDEKPDISKLRAKLKKAMPDIDAEPQAPPRKRRQTRASTSRKSSSSKRAERPTNVSLPIIEPSYPRRPRLAPFFVPRYPETGPGDLLLGDLSWSTMEGASGDAISVSVDSNSTESLGNFESRKSLRTPTDK